MSQHKDNYLNSALVSDSFEVSSGRGKNLIPPPQRESLLKAYLSKFKYVEADLVELFKMDRSTFYDRKKEAVLVFALALWGTVLPRLQGILDETEWPD